MLEGWFLLSAGSPIKVKKEAWSGGETFLAKNVARPMVRFLAQEAASGVLLLIATFVALFWANSVWHDSYHHFWESKFLFKVGSREILSMSLEKFVNDALMVFFFFVVGLEIKSELVDGELRDPRVAALPAVAAFGGVALPAAIYAFVNFGQSGSSGWGVPMATDIAFAVGVLALLGSRVPHRLKLFLLTLAIVDDIIAILVIAVFYTQSLNYTWLTVAVLLFIVVVLLKRLGVWYIPVYFLLGIVIWYATFQSGVHATIAGVALGLVTPARPLLRRRTFENVENILSGEVHDPQEIQDANWKMKESVAITTRLAHLFSPWTSFLVIPLFALANAGVSLSGEVLLDAFSSRVAVGIILGLVVGKPLGIFLLTYLGVKSGLASLPNNVSFQHILGGGAVAGIGFTLSLFIAKLAFVGSPDADQVLNEAIVGILIASVFAMIAGWLILVRASPQGSKESLVSESAH